MKPSVEARATRLSLLMLAAFLLLALNLGRMQIVRSGYYRTLSEKNRIRVVYLEPPRGRIFDRRGELLATNRLSFNCSVVPREAKKRIVKSSEILSKIIPIDAEEIRMRFMKRKPGFFNSVVIAEDIGQTQAMEIEEMLGALPGFMIETRPQREYPHGDATAHLVGYIGPMTEEEADRLEPYGYRQVDWTGRDGLEESYESYLRGRSGGLQMEVDSRGRYVRALGVKEPLEGKDLTLTVDARLQKVVQKLIGSQKGAVIVMELGEGGILAMNSSPTFDPNLFATAAGRKGVGHYLTDKEAPMVNRGIRGRYPPGSIFKIVTAMAALGRHKISALTSFNCPGYLIVGGNRFHCWTQTGHGSLILAQAFEHSCDVYFYNVGLLAGIDAIDEKAREFGFSKPTGIDLPGEKEGFVPSRGWKRKVRQQGWFDGDTANIAIGQGYLQVTPIQALVMIAATAMNGEIFKPHVVDKIEGEKIANRHTQSMTEPARHWRSIKEGLDQVINSDAGTGRLARQPTVRVAGKTGTAQSGQDKTHAWFVGYAPEENPKIALVVFLENGGRGGVSAATLAGAIFKWLKEAAYL